MKYHYLWMIGIRVLLSSSSSSSRVLAFANTARKIKWSATTTTAGKNVALFPQESSLSFYRSSSALYMSSSSKDDSVASKSRMPFSAPQNVPDDSITTSSSNNDDGMLSWSRLGLTNDLVDLLFQPQELDDRGRNWGGMGFVDGPTPVQSMAIPAILSGYSSSSSAINTNDDDYDYESEKRRTQHICFAAATGSGKTLAYLLPILQSIKSQELFLSSSDSNSLDRKVKRPKALILAPTRELAQQIYGVCKELSHVVKVSSQLLVGGNSSAKNQSSLSAQRKKLSNSPVDIIVATPGRLVKHVQTNHLFLGEVNHVVMDEMDTMLEQGFQTDLGYLLHILLYRRKGKISPLEIPTLEPVPDAPQVILTTATMTQAVQRLLKNEKKKVYSQKQQVVSSDTTNNNDYPIVLPTKQMRILTAPGLHRAVPRLRQVFVDVGNADKLNLLIDIVSSTHGGSGAAVSAKDRAEDGLTLVFANTVSSCRAAQHALAEASIPSLCYHGQLPSATRAENLQSFRKHNVGVLVCTDIAARGLDVPEVDHVVMFDFPLNPIDYIHRAGRTARGKTVRAGSGRVTALVAKRDQVLAMAIENAVQKGEPLDTLSSRKSDYINNTPNNNSNNYSNRRSNRGSGRRTAAGGAGGEGNNRRNSGSSNKSSSSTRRSRRR